MAKGNTLTLLALAGVGIATGGFGIPALAAAGAAGGAGAAGAAGVAAAGGFSLSGALTGGAALLSAGSSYFGSQAQAQGQKVQAAQQQLELAGSEASAAVDEQNRQERLRSMLATQNAIFGASNISASGVGDIIANDTIGKVNRQSSLASTLAGVNQFQYASGIDQSLSAADSYSTGGVLKAGTSLLSFAGQQYDRTRT